jgi:hypothetical protein
MSLGLGSFRGLSWAVATALALVASPAEARVVEATPPKPTPAPTPAAAAPPPSAAATTAAQAAPTRSADAILADHVTALGGKDVLGKHQSLRVKRTIAIKGMGIEGTEERLAAKGDRFLSTTSIPGMGVVRVGSDGKTFWAEDPINGLRLLTGPEREQARLDGKWNAELQMKKLYKKITPVAAPANAPKDVALECLELVPAEGHPMTACFDAQTHQRIYQTGRQSTPQGEIPFEARFSEWKTFEGVSLPTLEETAAGPTTIEARVAEVKFNEKIDPAVFKLKKPAAAKPDGAKAKAASAADGK